MTNTVIGITTRRRYPRSMAARNVVAIDTPALLEHVKIPVSTLNYWVREGLCGASVSGSDGKRATRYWSVRDLVTIKAIKELHDAGCAVREIKKVKGLLARHWNKDLSSAVLYYNGREVTFADDANEVFVSVLKDVGQVAFAETLTIITFPLQAWIKEGKETAKVIDIGALKKRRAQRREVRSA